MKLLTDLYIISVPFITLGYLIYREIKKRKQLKAEQELEEKRRLEHRVQISQQISALYDLIDANTKILETMEHQLNAESDEIKKQNLAAKKAELQLKISSAKEEISLLRENFRYYL